MRAIQMFLASGFFLCCALMAGAEVFAQSNAVEEPPTAKPTFALAELVEGKVRFDFGDTGHAIPVTERVAQTYTVAVPYTVKVTKDGKEVNETRTRMETRTRTIPVTRMVKQRYQSFGLEGMKLMTADGEELGATATDSAFEEKRPVVILQPGDKLDSFFKAVLKEDVIVVTLPKK